MSIEHHPEHHKSHRAGWLRAAVLGANDGIVSTASLIIGFAFANSSQESIFLAGLAGLVAGAMSMAAGEYVSVSSQADIETADLEMERSALEQNYDGERAELAKIYTERGLEPDLAEQVATQLMAHDALGAHARDEIGISDTASAQPIQAAVFSALSFIVGAFLPLLVVWLSPERWLISTVSIASLIFLALLGMLSAKAGGAKLRPAAIRVTFWGTAAMAATALVGHFFGVSVG